jgi:hypothetical protein
MKVLKVIYRVIFVILMILLDLVFIGMIANFDLAVSYTQSNVNNEIVVDGLVQLQAFFTQLSKVGFNLIVRITSASANADGTYNVTYDLIGPTFTPDLYISYFAIIGFFLVSNFTFAIIGAGNNRLSCVVTSAISLVGSVLFLLGPSAFNEFYCHFSLNGTDYLNYKLPISGLSGGLICAIMAGLVIINLILVLIFGGNKKQKVETSQSIAK